jgi:hypothetical protein
MEETLKGSAEACLDGLRTAGQYALPRIRQIGQHLGGECGVVDDARCDAHADQSGGVVHYANGQDLPVTDPHPDGLG